MASGFAFLARLKWFCPAHRIEWILFGVGLVGTIGVLALRVPQYYHTRLCESWAAERIALYPDLLRQGFGLPQDQVFSPDDLVSSYDGAKKVCTLAPRKGSALCANPLVVCDPAVDFVELYD